MVLTSVSPERTSTPMTPGLTFTTIPYGDQFAWLQAIGVVHLPAVVAPVGRTATGLPVGIQLAGPAFSENRVLDAAHALEQALGFDGSEARR